MKRLSWFRYVIRAATSSMTDGDFSLAPAHCVLNVWKRILWLNPAAAANWAEAAAGVSPRYELGRH
jgi:hypothetical protein